MSPTRPAARAAHPARLLVCALWLGSLAAGAAGCAGAPRAATAPSADAGAAPWDLPADALRSQRLYRLEFDSADGDGALRLVLRMDDAGRYRLTVADRLGRPLYTVDAAPVGGYLLDHREQRVCPLEADLRLEALPIDPLPLASLPAVLLGRVPAAPASRPAVSEDGGLDYRDADGRRWTATVAAGGPGEAASGPPVRWTLWSEGEPAVWWRLLEGGAMLSDRRRGLRMTWREVGKEPLAEPLAIPAAPADYRAGTCDTDLGAGPDLSDSA